MFTLGTTPPYHDLESEIQAVMPADLVTILAVDDRHEWLMRVHTSAPEQYATGAVWQLLPSQWQHQVFGLCERLVCANPDRVLEGFRDGPEILAHGYRAALAVPIARTDAQGKRAMGAVNLLFKQPLDLASDHMAQCERIAHLIDRFAANRLAKPVAMRAAPGREDLEKGGC